MTPNTSSLSDETACECVISKDSHEGDEMSNAYKLAPLRETEGRNPHKDNGQEPDDVVPGGSDSGIGNGIDDGFMSHGKPGSRRPSLTNMDPKDFDIDVPGTIDATDQVSTPDVNVYQQKKTLAQGMMDLALLSANANQLRYVLESGKRHPYFYPSLTLISISLIFQIAVGVGLILNSRYNVKRHEDMCHANRWNNFTVIGIFIVTITNVFISAFGVGEPVGSEVNP